MDTVMIERRTGRPKDRVAAFYPMKFRTEMI
jgi:hypothetical protein